MDRTPPHVTWLHTVDIIDTEEKSKFIDRVSLGEEIEPLHQLIQWDVPTPVLVEQMEETLREEWLRRKKKEEKWTEIKIVL